jgi:uncharacterized metal-binding protein YceD (DUF177 family)
VEFSRLVPLIRLAGGKFHQHIAADEAECSALAKRFGLVSLGRLEADVELAREAAGTILLTGAFGADFAQECIVTLDPVEGSVSEGFQLRYGLPDAEDDAPGGEVDPAFEPLVGETIDIGEAVAQEFSLTLPLFPRAVGAIIEDEQPKDPSESPFAALSGLGRRETR